MTGGEEAVDMAGLSGVTVGGDNGRGSEVPPTFGTDVAGVDEVGRVTEVDTAETLELKERV